MEIIRGFRENGSGCRGLFKQGVRILTFPLEKVKAGSDSLHGYVNMRDVRAYTKY
jgi:hypothetical protein